MDYERILSLTAFGHTIQKIERCSEGLLSEGLNPNDPAYTHLLRGRLDGFGRRRVMDAAAELIGLGFDPSADYFFNLMDGRLDGWNPDTCTEHPGYFLDEDIFYCIRCGDEQGRLGLDTL